MEWQNRRSLFLRSTSAYNFKIIKLSSCGDYQTLTRPTLFIHFRGIFTAAEARVKLPLCSELVISEIPTDVFYVSPKVWIKQKYVLLVGSRYYFIARFSFFISHYWPGCGPQEMCTRPARNESIWLFRRAWKWHFYTISLLIKKKKRKKERKREAISSSFFYIWPPQPK